MFTIILDILKNTIDFIKETDRMNIENKKRISENLKNISEVLFDTSEKLKKDEYPHMNCVILEQLSDNLQFQLFDVLSIDKVELLRSSLKEASLVEKQFALRKEPNTIQSIDEAAGKFKAMSIILDF